MIGSTTRLPNPRGSDTLTTAAEQDLDGAGAAAAAAPQPWSTQRETFPTLRVIAKLAHAPAANCKVRERFTSVQPAAAPTPPTPAGPSHRVRRARRTKSANFDINRL